MILPLAHLAGQSKITKFVKRDNCPWYDLAIQRAQHFLGRRINVSVHVKETDRSGVVCFPLRQCVFEPSLVQLYMIRYHRWIATHVVYFSGSVIPLFGQTLPRIECVYYLCWVFLHQPFKAPALPYSKFAPVTRDPDLFC